uniref:Uncharacterized protein n=1 Tax=Glossina austeni TaxID=7395 RepID=A0A1A9UJ98_GLOAU
MHAAQTQQHNVRSLRCNINKRRKINRVSDAQAKRSVRASNTSDTESVTETTLSIQRRKSRGRSRAAIAAAILAAIATAVATVTTATIAGTEKTAANTNSRSVATSNENFVPVERYFKDSKCEK